MKRLRTLAVLLAGGLGLAFACIAPAATAAHAAPDVLDYICNANGQCWFNNSVPNPVLLRTDGSGWQKVATGQTFDGNPVDEIETGSSTCASDGGNGTYLLVLSCVSVAGQHNLQFYFASSGAIVSVNASMQEGHLYCLTAESNGEIGNFRCPSGTPPGAARWTVTPS
jgi:hypothetical protein